MTTPDMMEALQALAAEKGMTTELLLEAVANGLESAYKRMPEAADDAQHLHVHAAPDRY